MEAKRVDLKVEIHKILASYSIVDNEGNYSIPSRYVEKAIVDISDMYDKQFNLIMDYNSGFETLRIEQEESNLPSTRNSDFFMTYPQDEDDYFSGWDETGQEKLT